MCIRDSERPDQGVLQQNILEDLLEKKLKEKAGIEVRWNHRLADLAMKNGAAIATIDELAMEGKGYGVPHSEMAVKKTCLLYTSLIDQASCTAGHSYACALHPRTLQLLDEVGLAQDAIKLGHKIETVAFYEGAFQRAELKLSLLPVEFPFVLVLQQNILERCV